MTIFICLNSFRNLLAFHQSEIYLYGMNKQALLKRLHEYPHSVEHSPIDFNTLDIALHLAMAGKPHSDKDIVVEQMNLALEEIDFHNPYRPFLIALKELYQQSIRKV
jgi:hypothetical protein